MTFDEIIHSFAQCETVPADAIRAALESPNSFVERAIPLLDRIATAKSNGDEDEAFGVLVHVLGEIGDERAFAPLMRVIALPRKKIDMLLGDTITETLGNVLISLAGDNAEAFESALADSDIDEYVRNAISDAWTWLVLTGKVEREKARAFLTEYPVRVGLDASDYGWSSWVDAVTILGFAEMRDFAAGHLAPKATDRSFFEMADVTYEDFERQLSDTLIDPECWQGKREYQPFTDTVGELSGWYGYSEEYRRERAQTEATGGEESDDWASKGSIFDAPYIAENIYKDVGRNDPCPCGSGKKFKKCCLN